VTERNRKRLILAASAAVLLLFLAFFTNPSQARHLQAIKETGALRRNPDRSIEDVMLSTVEYHNYLLFSTTDWLGNTTTYGYFGIVQTTNNIGPLYGGPPK
jgi:hypothetical protein